MKFGQLWGNRGTKEDHSELSQRCFGFGGYVSWSGFQGFVKFTKPKPVRNTRSLEMIGLGIVRWVGVTRSLSHEKKTWNFTNFSTPQHPSFTLRLNMISYLKNGGFVCTKKVPEGLSSDRTFGTWKPFFWISSRPKDESHLDLGSVGGS